MIIPLCSAMYIPIGTKIRIINENRTIEGYHNAKIGEIGKVIGYKSGNIDHCILEIVFEKRNYIYYHTLGGKCENGYGQYIPFEDVEILRGLDNV